MTAEVTVLDGEFAIHTLKSTDLIPPALFRMPFYWIGRTGQSLSLVCGRDLELNAVETSAGWRCLKVAGGTPSTLADVAHELRSSGLTFIPLPSADGAYGLITAARLPQAQRTLSAAGFQVDGLRETV